MTILDDLTNQMIQLAGSIDAPTRLLPSIGEEKLDSHPYVDYHNSDYHYIVRERGKEILHRQTASMDELLFWVFEAVTFEMSVAYELSHREPHRDPRRLIFQHQLHLLAKLNATWESRQEREVEDLLRHHPFTEK